MKFATKALLILGGLAVAALTTVSCMCQPRIRHLSADEFILQAREVERINSMHWDAYIGSTHSRAYLEHGGVPPFEWCDNTVVYWTELDQLPPGLAEQLRAGERPWKSPAESAVDRDDEPAMHTDRPSAER
jgi:hypothetical protein